jgi:Molecular chaperone GrpE (heat shock protein)
MTAEDNSYRPKMEAAQYPGGGREPTLDVPPSRDRAEPGDEPTPDPSSPGAAPAVEAAEFEKLKAEAADYKDKALRAVAELENYRRRADKERDDVSKYAISNFAREMLPVADNLRRALDAQPAATGEVAAPLKAFVSGVELTERELLAAFERFGLKKVEPLGQPFDHNFHQAMFELEDPNQPAGTVVQVMQPGYVLKDRLLRPALVAVSKGGAARSADERMNDGATSAAHGSYAAPNGGEGRHFDTKA